MKRQSQRWTFLALVLILSLGLSACAGAAQEADTSRSAPPCA